MSDKTAASSTKENWTTHDGVCISCRTRKIRCGREKPQCGSCSRDQVECVYSAAPKRVNHVKVLSQNFDDIQDRLILMQGELSWLTATLKRSNLNFDHSLPEPPSAHDTEKSSFPVLTPGHVVRHCGTQIERYYGPRTLVALCRDFEADLALHVGNSDDEAISSLANKRLLHPTTSDGCDDNLSLEDSPRQVDTSICLPPRQLLYVVLDTFLKQADYTTDIFCRQTICEAVERVYNNPSSPTSEPWALCFNLIILLTLGAEHPVRSEDPFVRPMLQAAHATARKPSFFMSPRLVNVQALTLFVSNGSINFAEPIWLDLASIVDGVLCPANTSLLSQQYHMDNKTLGDSFFAQACILARESGLHQTAQGLCPTSNLSPAEAEERHKVIRSLYIRDRFSGTACGALSWLPCGKPKDPSSQGTSTPCGQGGMTSSWSFPQYAPHVELAKIQDELHGLLCPADEHAMSISERRTALARVQKNLEKWTQTHKVPALNRPTTMDEMSLHLAFLGTRIRVLESENKAGDGGDAAHAASAQLINDARLSCLLVATCCNHNLNHSLVNRLHLLLNKTDCPFSRGGGKHSSSTTSLRTSSSSPFSATSSSAADAPQRTTPLTPPLSTSSLNQTPFPTPLPFHRLANVFPIAAVFVLARHILGIGKYAQSSQSSQAQNDEQRRHEIKEDIALLEALLLCFRTTPPPAAAAARRKSNGDTHGCKLRRVIQNLVDIIHAIVGPTGHKGAEDADAGDNEAVYSSEPLLASTSSLLLDAFSNAINTPNLGLYSNIDISPPPLSLPPTSSSSTWTAPADSTSSTATPLWTPQPSLSAPSTATMSSMLPDSPFDIAQFLEQMDAASPAIWEGSQVQAELQIMQMQAQGAAEMKGKRSRKRQRTDGDGYGVV